MHNKITKVAYITIGVYILLYFTLLSQYIKVPKLDSGQQALFDYQWYIPALLLLPLFIPKLMRVLSKLTNVKAWTVGGLTVLASCTTLHLMLKGGFWWSWPTVGLLLAVVILVMNLTKGKVTSGEGFLLGCGCALIVAGAWETIYQTGLWFYYDYFGDGIYNFFLTATRLSIWILTGVIILLATLKKHKGLAHTNGAFTACAVLFAMFTAVWFTNGMYVQMWWHEGAGPFLNEPNPLMMSMIRGSKAFIALTPAMLFITKRGRR